MTTPADQPRKRPGAGARWQRWILAIALAVAVHGAAFLSLGVAPVRGDIEAAPVQSSVWVGERMGETIDLIDPEPLFLPTERNAASQLPVNLGAATDAGAMFRLFGPSLTVPPGESPRGLVNLPEGVRTAGVAIQRFTRPYFSALGERDLAPAALPARTAMLDVRIAATGESVWRRNLVLEDVQATARARGLDDPARWPFWEPFELLVTVETTGGLGLPLVPAPGSGVEAVDHFFRTTFEAFVRTDLVLRPGYYQVLISP